MLDRISAASADGFINPGRLSSYRIRPLGDATRFTIETRVANPTDPAAARKFGRYWPTVGRAAATATRRRAEQPTR